jgi:hypothetical protein
VLSRALISHRRVLVTLITLCAATGGLLLASTPALAYRAGFSLQGHFGSAGSGDGELSNPTGVAVNDSTSVSDPAAGDVYVADTGNNRVERFSSTGVYLSQFNGSSAPTGALSAPESIAVDNSTNPLDPSAGDVYVTDPGADVIDKFSPTGIYEGQLTGFNELLGVTVDNEGNVWVSDRLEGDVNVEEFNTTGEFVKKFWARRETRAGFGVDSADNVYVVTGGREVTKFNSTTGAELGEFSQNVTALAIDQSTDVVLVDQGNSIEEYGAFGEPFSTAITKFPAKGLSESHGIAVNDSTGELYATQSTAGDVEIFEEVGPSVTTGQVSGLGSTSAMVTGTVNPEGVQVTSCAFEYGSEAGVYPHSVPCSQAMPLSGVNSLAVSAELTDLSEGSIYDYRLTATDANGNTSMGQNHRFATGPLIVGQSFSNVGSGSAELSAQINPEGLPTTYYVEYGPSTAYGSTTPAVGIGAGESSVGAASQLTGLTPSTVYHLRFVAVNQTGRTLGSDMTFITLPAGVLGLPDGRVFERVTPIENEDANVYVPNAFGVALPLSEGIFTGLPFRAAADGEAVVYVADPTSGGTGRGGYYAGNNYLATRSPTGGWTQSNITPTGHVAAGYSGFSENLSFGFLISRSEETEEEGVPPLSPEAPGSGYLIPYERINSDGSYQPLVTKADTLHRSAEEFEARYVGSSTNQSVILFEANDALTANAVEGGKYEDNLYVLSDGQLSLVNVLPDGSSTADVAPGGSGDLGHVMSADGSRIFWTDLSNGNLYMRETPTASDARTVQVDAEAPGGGGGKFWTATSDGSKVFFTKGDLYEYDVETGQTIDLTPGVEVAGVVGTSENGEYIYYVDAGYDLRLWHRGTSTLIATLSQQDGEGAGPFSNEMERTGDWQPNLGTRTAEVTPDGRSVVFMSNQSLKAVGYPDGYANEGMYEVYVYEAEGGELFCASCNPSGEPPQENQETTLGSGPGKSSAAFLPISFNSSYTPRWISEGGGQVFFDSDQPLVPQDTNGKQDVYEWERDGVGSCREANGCIYLLSGGTGESASWLLATSSSGDDVFVISRTELVPGDPYDSFDLYDARVGGLRPLAPSACSGTGCQGVPPAPPIFATPASVTFDGVGNFPAQVKPAEPGKGQLRAKPPARAQKLARALKACNGKPHRKLRLCQARARKRYAKKSKTGKSATRKTR